ncbi:hypothetical protein Oweho_1861 [Owenweeksia hongkongensis DSM 17368]|uniref:Uncharacterized protein n=1 Tax=Owenweeksia hongkongensis (strain DSM 17368 / CIP 108786 / JCM 12287 / NRRL B-23963 / UST20020801) TaxID=926562 RepID=G8R1R4_OWEHD|nr:hypothetical protein [Owenweeksia hongkongensis]AEV32840.1 hypothetical protein Oweho_1861 [Owenweeksia hongkongensis DSM 17368]
MRYLYFLFATFLLLTSCEKLKKDDDDEGRRIIIKSNSPVKAGEKLKVWVEVTNPDWNYELLHPLGTTHGTSYTTDSANIGDDGVYIVTASGQSEKKDSILVKVDNPPISCTPPNNAVMYSSGNIKHFTSGSREITERGYEIWVFSDTEWMMFRFKSDDILDETSTYASTSNRSNIKENQVYCYLIKYGATHVNDPGQPVLVEIEDERMILTVCDFLVQYDTFSERIDVKLTFSL